MLRLGSRVLFVLVGCLGGLPSVKAQQIDFVEKFALAEDRQVPLQELIPNSPDYFFYQTLDRQNRGKFNEAAGLIDQWQSQGIADPRLDALRMRQMLLTLESNPEPSFEYLRTVLNLNLQHTAPETDRANTLPSEVDPDWISPTALRRLGMAHGADLSPFSDLGLALLRDQPMTLDLLRLYLRRITRLDEPNLVPNVLKELKDSQSRGWGSLPIHAKLTLAQREELCRALPNLLENDRFVREYLLRLQPGDFDIAHDWSVRESHLERLEAFANRLPPSGISLLALVMHQRLVHDRSRGVYDLDRFEKYLALPRQMGYYSQKALKEVRNRPLVELQSNYQYETRIPPIGNDESLIRDYLEHFIVQAGDGRRFAKWMDSDVLRRIEAEAKILHAIGDPSPHYAQFSAQEQKAIRDRIELRFTADMNSYWKSEEAVQLRLDLKNVKTLVVRVYALNPRSVFRKTGQAISTGLDLDGLVPNLEQTIEYSQPADRRHRETIPLPICDGRGIWMVDVLGGGMRSRAMIVKGQLRSTQLLTDAGHEIRIWDENGKAARRAVVELGDRVFKPDEEGNILIPYSEREQRTSMLLVDEAVVGVESLHQRQENYELQAGIVMDSQNVLAGSRATIVIRPTLLCLDNRVPLALLEEAQLSITMVTDKEGITSTSTVPIDLHDDQETLHRFLVPPRLQYLNVRVTGKVVHASTQQKHTVQAERRLEVNTLAFSTQVASFYLLHDEAGYRLQVRGRNGELKSRIPIDVQLRSPLLQIPYAVTMATNARGELNLGKLVNVNQLTVSADSMMERSFSIGDTEYSWPTSISVRARDTVRLPWVPSSNLKGWAECTLIETRQGVEVADWSHLLKYEQGQVRIEGLASGSYWLRDNLTGGQVGLSVVDGVEAGEFLLSDQAALQRTPHASTSIRHIAVTEDKVQVQLANETEETRILIVAHPFVPDRSLVQPLRPSRPPMMNTRYHPPTSNYLSEMRLDEEYQYVLQRLYGTKYPGNMLAQPSLLLNPWSVASTETSKQDPSSGDPMMGMAPGAPSQMAKEAGPDNDGRDAAEHGGLFEFLKQGSRLVANLRPTDGGIEIARQDLQGMQAVSVVVLSRYGVVSQRIGLPAADLATVDLRLAKAFESGKHWMQQLRVMKLEPNQVHELGDASLTRLQVYAKWEDLFRLYASYVPNQGLEPFRRWASWPQLQEEEKQSLYNQLACHEFHLFLYSKDRAFFDKIVRPFLSSKHEQKIVDDWILERPLDRYQDLWRRRNANVLERLLLAERVAAFRTGEKKWVLDSVQQRKMPLELEKRYFLAALQNSLLADSGEARSDNGYLGLAMEMEQLQERKDSESLGRFFVGDMPQNSAADARDERPQGEGEATRNAPSGGGMGGMGGGGMGGQLGAPKSRRGKSPQLGKQLYQSLDLTKEWSESQFYRVPMGQQTAELIAPSAVWSDLAESFATNGFLSKHLHHAPRNMNEALSILALTDLPFETAPPKIEVTDGRLRAQVSHAALAFLDTLEDIPASKEPSPISVGHDIYESEAHGEESFQKPSTSQALVRGLAYRSHVVINNRTGRHRDVAVLIQIPEGAIPLQGGKKVECYSVRLDPFATSQFQLPFYFPEAGSFAQYGVQVAVDGAFVAETERILLRVLEVPETTDQGAWSYVALWGTDAQVLEYLRTKNTQGIDLAAIAFRMQNPTFFKDCLEVLTEQGLYDAQLWAYAVRHGDKARLAEFLAHHDRVVEMVHPWFHTSWWHYDSAERNRYQHLDYRPFVNARAHQLGASRTILNDRFRAQYHETLKRLAYQPTLLDEDRMAITYYLLLQGRIEEALKCFQPIRREGLDSQLQYDYMAAYLDFYRGDYDHAAEIATRYANYGVPRWREWFGQIALQVRQRQALLSGTEVPQSDVASQVTDPIQRLLMESRNAGQAALASTAPSLDLHWQDKRLSVSHKNLQSIEVRFYLMDIELLFSRNPFVQNQGEALLAILPNQKVDMTLKAEGGRTEIRIPEALANRNLVVEVSGEGLIRSQAIFANQLELSLVSSFGQLEVLNEQRKPVEKVYVKVYARHADGRVQFYKDGYTDLRGQFDYASLSTNDLTTVQRFAILILHPEKGALIREIEPPQR